MERIAKIPAVALFGVFCAFFFNMAFRCGSQCGDLNQSLCNTFSMNMFSVATFYFLNLYLLKILNPAKYTVTDPKEYVGPHSSKPLPSWFCLVLFLWLYFMFISRCPALPQYMPFATLFIFVLLRFKIYKRKNY
ncbi:MAG: hypothetical protein ACKO37_08795 [Vampirovibrionales bacterium]